MVVGLSGGWVDNGWVDNGMVMTQVIGSSAGLGPGYFVGCVHIVNCLRSRVVSIIHSSIIGVQIRALYCM